jgi:hypothetical protein
MKLLAFFLYKDFTRSQIMSYFFQRKILEMPIILELFSESRFHPLKYLHFADNESTVSAHTAIRNSIY